MGVPCVDEETGLCRTSHTMTSVMSAVQEQDLTPLLEEMRWRREGAGTPYKVNQSEIARDIGRSSSYISLLEAGKRNWHKVPGHHLYIILRGYGYTPSEIQGIVARYRLNAPPQLVDDTAEPGTVVVLSEGGVSQPGVHGEVTVRVSDLHNVAPSVVRERRVMDFDLATAKAQERAGVGAQLLVSAAVAPTDDSLVIIEEEGVQALAVWPVKADWVTPYTIGGPYKAMPIGSSNMRLVAVVVSVNLRQPFIHPGGAES